MEKYQIFFNDVIQKVNSFEQKYQKKDGGPKVDPMLDLSKKEEACEIWKDFKNLVLKLKQEHRKYIPMPCLSDWPCIFTQHRTEIRNRLEEAKSMKSIFEKDCDNVVTITRLAK